MTVSTGLKAGAKYLTGSVLLGQYSLAQKQPNRAYQQTRKKKARCRNGKSQQKRCDSAATAGKETISSVTIGSLAPHTARLT